MINGVSKGFCFKHVAVLGGDGSILAIAVETATLFLIKGNEEQGYCRRSQDNGWQVLDRDDLTCIVQALCHDVVNGRAVMAINGTADSIINKTNHKRRNTWKITSGKWE